MLRNTPFNFFKNFSLKTKIFMAIFLSIISIFIFTYEGYENRMEVNKNNLRNNISINNDTNSSLKAVDASKESTAVQSKDESSNKKDEIVKQDNAAQSQDSTIQKQDNTNKNQESEIEKQKKLDEVYQEGYKAFHSGNYSNAIELENQVLAEDSGYYKAYSIIGIAKCYSGNYDDGMKDIDKSLEIKSDYGYGRFNKALALELYEHFDESLLWYDKALEIENYAWSYYGKASIYGRRGDVQNTAANLKKAIEFDSGAKVAARTEKDFNNVRGSNEFKELLND